MRHWLLRAWRDTWSLFRSHYLVSGILAVAYIAASLFWQAGFQSSKQAIEELHIQVYQLILGPLVVWMAVFLYNFIVAPYKIEREESETLRDQNGSLTGDQSLSNGWSGIVELRKCHEELVDYMALPRDRLIAPEEIAASANLKLHLKRTLQVLDRQAIPHPGFNTDGLVIDDTLRWSNFLSRILACPDDLDGARRAGEEFVNEPAE